MRRMLLVGAVALGLVGVARADDKIVVKDNKGTTIIINGPVIVRGNNNIVQIGSNNKVIVSGKAGSKTPSGTRTLTTGNKRCNDEAARHNAQVTAWMAMMGKR